jgi:hypothetical protein
MEVYRERKYIANMSRVLLVKQSAFRRIENKTGTESETFEYISPNTKTILVRGKQVAFNPNWLDYEKLGIVTSDTSNPRQLIAFEDLLRYWQDTNPTLIQATDADIRQHLPRGLPKLLTLDHFHFESTYGPIPPSAQETYRLLARILVTRDTSQWKPTQRPNNDWRNWKSGSL